MAKRSSTTSRCWAAPAARSGQTIAARADLSAGRSFRGELPEHDFAAGGEGMIAVTFNATEYRRHGRDAHDTFREIRRTRSKPLPLLYFPQASITQIIDRFLSGRYFACVSI